MKMLSTLSLEGTGVQEIPSSIDHLIGLISLDLKDCISLLCLPTAICKNLEEIKCLEELDLSGTTIREAPSSLFRMKNLKVLSLRGCEGPPPKSWNLFLRLGLFSGKSHDPMGLVLTIVYLYCLSKLDLSDCSLCEGAIPDDIGCLSSLEDLTLRGNDFVSLPKSIRWLNNLKFLNLESCKRLEQLPDLPSNEELTVTADDCTSLKVVFFFRAVNCYRLVGNQASNNMIFSMLKRFIQGTPPFVVHSINIVTPGSEIPKWFSDRRVGDTVVVMFALSAVFAPQENPTAFKLDCLGCDACGIKCFSRADSGQVQSDHLWLLYLCFKGYEPNNDWKGDFRKFEFSFKTFCSREETKKCLKLRSVGYLNNPIKSRSLYKPIDNSAHVQSSISMEKITENLYGAG
ncbi:TMV resistance protein N-like [Pyrus ussuriensis x Pyrus communis]|uniref:TMV resistance protein N-like n=1 Tax=Pyrus ussuriensis x Pyrus communis TaxID=2448454 RepID=A0A5N5I7P9_9ROSA|nr:TMV resistance protein N-like [Pyrus ussuriensis x Pyrus communis]